MTSFIQRDHLFVRKSIGVVVAFTVLRMLASFFIELGNDESYYLTFAKQLQINYFDHPPLVAIWIKFFTANLSLQNSLFFIRLGSFTGCAISSYFIYKTINAIASSRAAYIGVFLYNISFYASITAGVFITPDMPQMVFFTCSLFFITRILAAENKMFPWVLFGICAGLSIMSKVHAVFLWGGVFFYALFYRRAWFINKGFYISAFVTAVVISPILIWNIQNDFITFRFHGERVVVKEDSGIHVMGLIREIIGQFVINSPFLIGAILFFFSKKYSGKAKQPLVVFKLIAIPLLVIIFLISLFRTSLPHWSGPAYIALLPVAAIGLADVDPTKFKRIQIAATIYTMVVVLLVVAAINLYPGSFSNEKGIAFGKNDNSLDAYGWKEGGEKFAAIYKSRNAFSKVPMVCNTWWGAHDEYYFARPLNIKMIGLGRVLNIHHYAWRLNNDSLNIKMDTAYTVVHSYDYFDAKKEFANYYSNIDSIATIPITRNNKLAYNFYVYELTGWKGKY